MKLNDQDKICRSCYRKIEYRKKWESCWDEIKYCSDECKKNKFKYDYTESLLKLTQERGFQKTICPSEVLEGEDKKNKSLMELVRRSARKLAFENKIEILQNNKIVPFYDYKGPIRLRIKKSN